MTATNHAVTGALVAVAINNPAVALPVALLSHFVTDAFPHWDYYKFAKTKNTKRNSAALDFMLAVSLIVVISLTAGASAWLVVVCGLLGVLPDSMWLPFIVSGKESVRGNINSPINLVRWFHLKIQWLESPKLIGLYSEIAWFGLVLWLIYRIHN